MNLNYSLIDDVKWNLRWNLKTTLGTNPIIIDISPDISYKRQVELDGCHTSFSSTFTRRSEPDVFTKLQTESTKDEWTIFNSSANFLNKQKVLERRHENMRIFEWSIINEENTSWLRRRNREENNRRQLNSVALGYLKIIVHDSFLTLWTASMP